MSIDQLFSPLHLLKKVGTLIYDCLHSIAFYYWTTNIISIVLFIHISSLC